MNLELLYRHKFQMISFGDIYHAERSDSGNIQVNNDSHLIHICRARATITMENRTYPLQPGDVIAVPQYTPFSMTVEAGHEMMNIHYRLWLEDGTLLEDVKRLPLIFTPPYFNWCREKLTGIRNLRNQHPVRELPDARAHEIVLRHLAENPVTELGGTVADLRLEKARTLLENPGFIKFDSGRLTASCRLSKSQLNRNFRKWFGVSPQKYWEKQRLKAVCLLLKKSSLTIYETAEKAGFDDCAYFCRWFRKMTGCTPVQYRKKLAAGDTVI